MPLLILVAVLVLAAVGATALAASFHQRAAQSVKAALQPADHAMVFLVSGLSPDDLHLASLPNMSGLARAGTRYTQAWVGQLEVSPTTSAATIGTGVYPRSHGIVGGEWRDSKAHAVISSSDPVQARLGALDQILQAHNVPSLAGDLKARHPTARVLAIGGPGCAAASAAGTWVADYTICPIKAGGRWIPGWVAGHAAPSGLLTGAPWSAPVKYGSNLAAAMEGWKQGALDNWIARVGVRMMRATSPRLTIVDFPEVATLAHWVPGSQRRRLLAGLLKGIDRDIGMFMAEARREKTYARTVFVLTSDGAVAPVRVTVDRAKLEEAILAAGGEKTYLDADGSAMIGLRDRLEASPVAQALQAERMPGVDEIYFKVRDSNGWTYRAQYANPDLPAAFARATDYLLWTLVSDASPDLAAIYSPGTTSRDLQLWGYHWTGTGGGAQWPNQHIPLIISGHGISAGAVSSYPARLVDVAPTLETVMSLASVQGDGVPLADALIRTSNRARSHQRTTERWLGPLVRALELRAEQRAG